MIDEKWKACTGANSIKMIVFKCFQEKGKKKKNVIVKMIDYNDIRSIVIRIHVYFVVWLKGDIFVIISLKLPVWISIFPFSFNCHYIFFDMKFVSNHIFAWQIPILILFGMLMAYQINTVT